MKKESSSLLADVNVLLAVAWPNHQFHHAARRALTSWRGQWASCALTQLGFIRLSSNPAVVAQACRPEEAAALLAQMTADPLHVYLGTLPAPAAEPSRHVFQNLLGHQQVTDAYLIHLAALNDATLLTFDARLPHVAAGLAAVRVLS